MPLGPGREKNVYQHGQENAEHYIRRRLCVSSWAFP